LNQEETYSHFDMDELSGINWSMKSDRTQRYSAEPVLEIA